MLIFKCRRCGCEARTFEKWTNHFWGNSHQVSVRKTFLDWSDQDNLTSLVVYAPSEVAPPLPSDVISLFHKLSMEVEDFVCWTAIPRMFIVQLETSDEVESFLQLVRQKADEVKIGGQPTQARRKSDVLEYEWAIMVGDGTTKEGSSKDPVLIELNDEQDTPPAVNGEVQQNSSRKKKKSREGNRNSNEENEASAEAEPELAHQNGNGCPVSSTEEDEVEQDTVDIKIKTKMNNKFITAFNSKIKPEETEDAVDDKRKVKENLRLMQEKWVDEIYLEFFNKLWPTCFGLGNTIIKGKKLRSVGFEVTCQCRSRQSGFNDWARKKDNSKEYEELVNEIVNDFLLILDNGKLCNKRLKTLDEEPDNSENPLSFTCHLLVLYHDNTSGPTAELTISKFKGKGHKKTRKLIDSMYTKLFKQYEKIKIKKFAASEKDKPLRNCKNWSQIVTVQLD